MLHIEVYDFLEILFMCRNKCSFEFIQPFLSRARLSDIARFCRKQFKVIYKRKKRKKRNNLIILEYIQNRMLDVN